MTEADRKQIIGYALDHVDYQWAPCLPVRHDGREWTEEEVALYNKTYKDAFKEKIRLYE